VIVLSKSHSTMHMIIIVATKVGAEHNLAAGIELRYVCVIRSAQVALHRDRRVYLFWL
jgi:hypothetical protein